jgi:hypothetical protein
MDAACNYITIYSTKVSLWHESMKKIHTGACAPLGIDFYFMREEIYREINECIITSLSDNVIHLSLLLAIRAIFILSS